MGGDHGDEAGVRFKDPRPRSDEWAGLLSANLTHIAARLKMPLETIDDLLKMQDRGVKLYMHDASIDHTCPQLFKEFKFPRYFPFDFQRQKPADELEGASCGPDSQHRWSNENGVLGVGHPSLFIGPQVSHSRSLRPLLLRRLLTTTRTAAPTFCLQNSESMLHVDARMTRFWMAMISGTKHW